MFYFLKIVVFRVYDKLITNVLRKSAPNIRLYKKKITKTFKLVKKTLSVEINHYNLTIFVN